jgi:Tol biopolymer transport system component
VARLLWVPIVVAIAGLAAVAAGCGAKPAGTEAGRLVYDVGTENGAAAAGIFVVDDQGKNRRRLTSQPPPVNVAHAEWSPKGGTILFHSEMTFAEEFWTIEADGSGLRRIGKGLVASWSPDGREIAIVDAPDELSIVDKHGARGRTIRLGLEDRLSPDAVAAWSPDGSLIAMNVVDERTESVVYVVATDGKSRAKPLGRREEGVSEHFAAWSPDGKAIAFVRVYADASHGSEAWVMGRDGAGRRRVAAGVQDVWWSEDGKSLLFTASDTRAPGLYRVPIGEGDPVRLSHSYHLTDDFREPGGKRILRFDRGKLIVSRLDGSGKKVLLNEPHQDRAPLWSPDGTRITFIRGGEEIRSPSDVYVIGADGKGERWLTTGGSPVWLRDGRLLIRRKEGYAVADADPNRIVMPVEGVNPAISPDGTLIAFVRHRSIPYEPTEWLKETLEVQSTLFVQRTNGTGVRELARTSPQWELVFDAPVWSRDGQSIFIREDDPLGGGSARIRRILVDGGTERAVARETAGFDIELFAVAPDGNKVALTTQSGIDVLDLDGKGRKTVWSNELVAVSDLKWSPDGQKLAYIGWDHELEGVYELFVMDADGSDVRRVSKRGDAVGAFDWAP